MAKVKDAPKRKIEVEVRPYELMLILDPNLRDSEVKKKLKELTDMFEKAGGKVTHEDFWDKRKFSYKLKGNSEGIYMVYNLELPNNFIKELRDFFRIEKEVLRSMIISLPADYTYTKYDLDAEPEKPAPRKERPRRRDEKNESIKHSASTPAAAEKKVEVKVEDKGKEVDEKELDKKLDEIIGGDDLKL